MGFQVSPGILVSEIDLTTVIPAISTTTGAIAGVFSWGPVGRFSLVNSENTLAQRFGKPTNNNAETFFTAANFLSYSNALYVSRAATVNGWSNAVSTTIQSNTTLVVSGNTAGIAVGHGVYGTNIANGTYVTAVTANSTALAVTISTAATATATNEVLFFANAYSFNAVANTGEAANLPEYLVKNADVIGDISTSDGVMFVARYVGELGNSLKVSVCDSPNQYSSNINPYAISVNSTFETNSSIIPGNSGIIINVNERTANVYVTVNGGDVEIASAVAIADTMKAALTVGDLIEVGNTTIGKQKLKIKSLGSVSNTSTVASFTVTLAEPFRLSSNYTGNTVSRFWEYFTVVNDAPETSLTVEGLGRSVYDEMHIVVTDEDGKFSGVSGTILEVFNSLSRATDSKTAEGNSNYYKTAINDFSSYIWALNDRSGAASNTAALVATSTATTPSTISFVGGRDGFSEASPTFAALADAYNLFADTSSVDVSLIMSGKTAGTSGIQLANYIIDNITEVRKDCVAFISPQKSDVVGSNFSGQVLTNVLAFRAGLRATSYGLIDCGYKYQYDKYNDVYRWVPLNGDTAGITARSDDLRDPWYSPAGFSRGQVKNLIKLAWNPNKAERDELYKKDINSVVSYPGQGTILYGDKTMLGRPSAFDRINVRRLFIILEKTISTAAQSTLFEFNDDFTRAQFKNLVEPFLRDVQGRRGIYDFKVVCDETNNTQEVIDANRFVGDIYIKPAKSINFIQLNFIAVRSGVEFSEVVGKF